MGDWTQGPWENNGDGWIVGANGVEVVRIGSCRVADARLIAAAPELYEALRELDPANGHRTDCNERKCGECSTCRARAALAKAEGRS